MATQYRFDPELADLVELLPDGLMDTSNPEKTRAGFIELIDSMNADLDYSGVQMENRSVPGPEGAPDVPVRIYTPEGLAAPTAGILQIHGGGFVVGNLDSEMGTCLNLCRQLGVVIVSVDYRLAPEVPYPGPLHDCYAALRWMHAHADDLQVDASRIAVYGMSAGGGLAAALCLLARDRGGPAICFQYLGIPELDDRLDTASMRAFNDTPMWNRPNAVQSWDAYLGDSYRRGASDVPYLAAPARANDLADLPPAYVSTMEFDPLRDEGIEYALKLLRAGVQTELHSFPGTFHGSAMFTHANVSQREAGELLAILRRGLKLDD
ncbi:MAG: alpha/beta hydrolase [Halioglobus sp.]